MNGSIQDTDSSMRGYYDRQFYSLGTLVTRRVYVTDIYRFTNGIIGYGVHFKCCDMDKANAPTSASCGVWLALTKSEAYIEFCKSYIKISIDDV